MNSNKIVKIKSKSNIQNNKNNINNNNIIGGNVCKCCLNNFKGNSSTQKYCPKCIEIIDNTEKDLPVEIDNLYDYLLKITKEKDNNFNFIENQFNNKIYISEIQIIDNNVCGGYLWLIFNIKRNNNNSINENYYELKYLYKKCQNCFSYILVNYRKVSYNALIDQIENDDPITCSRKCQNNLKVKNGMYFKCKSCEKVFLNFNPRKYRCDNCEKELDYLY